MDPFLSIFNIGKNIIKAGKAVVNDTRSSEPFTSTKTGIAYNTVLGLPQAAKTVGKTVKDFLLPTRGYTEAELKKAEPSLGDYAKSIPKLGAEFAGVGNLLNLIPRYERGAQRIADTKVGSKLADIGGRISDFGVPKTVEEAKAMRFADIATFLPMGSVKAVKGVQTAHAAAIFDHLPVIEKALMESVSKGKKLDVTAIELVDRMKNWKIGDVNQNDVRNVFETLARNGRQDIVESITKQVSNEIKTAPLLDKAKAIIKDGKQAVAQPRDTVGRFDVKPTVDPLTQEAKKYKSAEEFVNNAGKLKTPYDWNYLDEMRAAKNADQPYSHSDYGYLSKLAEKYRGKEPSEPFFRAGNINKSSLGEKLDNIYLTDNEGLAQQYAGGGSKVGEYRVLSQNPLNATDSEVLKKILGDRYNELPNSPSLKEKLIKYAKDNGYDSVRFPDSGPDGEGIAGHSLVVWDKNLVKTKSQLTEIWNKANGKGSSEAFGVVAGFEEDEDGKLRFDPMKAAFGVAGMTAFNRGKGFMKKGVVPSDPVKTLANVEKRVGAKPISLSGRLSKNLNPELEIAQANKLQEKIGEAKVFGRTLKEQKTIEAQARLRKQINRAEYDPGYFDKKPPKLTPELEQKAIGIEIAKESIANNPLNQLIKYASKTGENKGKLPEVLGGKGTSGFKKKGDDIITEVTGRQDVDSETVRSQFESFMAQKQAVKEAEIALKQEVKALRYSSEGIPLATPASMKVGSKGQTTLSQTRKSLSPTKNIPTYVGSTGEVRTLEQTAKESEQLAKKENYSLSQVPSISLPKIIEKLPTPVKSKVWMLDYMRTPENVLKKIGLSKQMDVVRRGYDGYLKELPQNIDKITEWSKQVPKESGARLFRYLDGKAIDLTPQELKVANEIKVWLAEWADRLGLPEDNRITNYITHLFDDQLIKKEFDEDLAKIIAEKVPGSVYDPFLQKRLGAKGYREDVWKALDAYVKRGTRKVHMDPALQVLEEASTGLEQSQWNYVKRFADRVNMRPTEVDNLIDNGIKAMIGYRAGQRPVARASQGLRRMTYRGMLGLNVGSALRNLSQGINTYAKLGEKYTALGYSKLFSPANLAELKTENVLTSQFVQDRSISAIKTTMQKVDKGLFFFFETAEKINRGAAYFGAKAKGIASGMSEKQAIEYGKKIVRETQFAFGSIDTPVGMSSDIVKTLTQFQTFTTKQIEFLAGMAKNKEYAGLIRYAIAGAAFVYTVGQAFGMDLKDLLPIYRLGTPPSLKLPVTAVQIAAGGDKDAGDLAATLPGYIPGGVQAKKTIQGVQSVREGGSYDKSGRLQFEQGESKAQQLQSILFGKYAGKNAEAYFKGEKPTRNISDIKKAISSDLKSGKIDVSVAKERYIGEVKKLASEEKKTRSTMPLDAYKKDLARAIEEKVITVAEAKKEYIDYTKKIETEEKRALAMKTEYPDKDIKTLVKVYAKALGTDPVNAFKALVTSEKIDKVEGNAVLLQRMKGAHFLNPGGSEEYIKERLSEMDIPWSKREDYNLEHIVPVGAGGNNDDDNLQIISNKLHESYTSWDTKAGNAVKNGTMTRGEVAKIARKLKVDKSISIQEALSMLK